MPNFRKGVPVENIDPYLRFRKLGTTMIPTDDFRFQSHVLLVELDAATTQLMMLVVAGELSGSRWDEAFARQSSAYTAWVSAAQCVQTDPMPVPDGRPDDGTLASEK